MTKIDTEVLEAIAMLDPDDPAHWTKETKIRPKYPNATVLTELVGRKVSADERDVAWAHLQEKAEETSKENGVDETTEPGSGKTGETDDGAPTEIEPENAISDSDSGGGHAGPSFMFIGTYPAGKNTSACRGYLFEEGQATRIEPVDAITINKLRANPMFEEVESAN